MGCARISVRSTTASSSANFNVLLDVICALRSRAGRVPLPECARAEAPRRRLFVLRARLEHRGERRWRASRPLTLTLRVCFLSADTPIHHLHDSRRLGPRNYGRVTTSTSPSSTRPVHERARRGTLGSQPAARALIATTVDVVDAAPARIQPAASQLPAGQLPACRACPASAPTSATAATRVAPSRDCATPAGPGSVRLPGFARARIVLSRSHHRRP
ncbi:hypothetical protein AMAG_20142 [Allomyces macrogynus ATCC 38327]|uniref:Uncharacterized protein n=1 Tax=Allomyces macrogynus (strain ATCC 38327) TaxID=578462 RepID=A0A0L0T5U9_ALLM3|nr:hypothetical protein AMAG_20142 [Allomyces macrogynus ATCC 38327]|eukprot:KNE69939.1 hypothetical protein AMAG_20142 [Allomyces macrogynus ATCC 38327]